MTLLSAALLLFLVMDPFGNIPFFIAALKPVDPKRHIRVIIREMLIALAALIIFLFVGQYLLNLLHITRPALNITGGVVLFLIAIKMIFPTAGHGENGVKDEEPFIVPLAIPYVAGPSAMATVLLIVTREPSRSMEWLAAVALAWFGTALVLSCSGVLARMLGRKALTAIERLMGMLLVGIAIQMIMDGIKLFVKTL